ncbi:MAG: PKD domain-containing protein [Pseudopedobacter saltans]|uniref:PKD domain-containing protein n=1 Tax=Pseudopedobacter saltans TaxID=151895 RepID=A0A2W5GRP0_9SPHI|nr:MAG: PKD domain-containing protein [Pseudopedobacter saltans]
MKRKLLAFSIAVTFILASCAKNETVVLNPPTVDSSNIPIVQYKPVIAVDSSHATMSKVLEFNPAPGQFMNETIGTQAQAQKLAYDSTFKTMISLGAWGGFIAFKFDHSVQNANGADLAIYGNPFSGWDEPGIVMVSQDFNNNGIADDPWYELAGSQYDSTTTIHNYKVTYYNPGDYVAGGKNDIPWKDNQGNSGVIAWNSSHRHSFFPLETSSPNYNTQKDSIMFEGSRLRTLPLASGIIYNNIVNLGWWGYSDTYSKGAGPDSLDNYAKNKYNSFDIDWARDSNGKKVKLNYIDFVKVYTGQLANGGILGEVSTEFLGARDLHIQKL